MVQRGRVERRRVRRQREMPNGGAGDLDLRILQLCIGNLRGQPMKNLAGKRRRRQALRRFRGRSQLAARIGAVTPAEEDALVEYLAFLRSRRKKGSHS